MENMEHIAPLIQTILWVGLISVIVWRFYKPLYDLLLALSERIKSGSNIKAGPFELSDMQPQLPTQQAAKANAEISEAYLASTAQTAPVTTPAPATTTTTTIPAPTTTTTPAPTQQFKAKYFLAEDLALRALQSEFGEPINRQITAGQDKGFDGAFVKDRQLHIVEVKYSSGRHTMEQVQSAIRQIKMAVNRYGWKSVQIVIALVVDDAELVYSLQGTLADRYSDSDIPVEFRVYSLPELESKFGLSAAAD